MLLRHAQCTASAGLRRFANDTRGTTALIFALTLIPVVATVGAAVDYGRALRDRAQMQNTLDSAVLAAGRKYQVTQEKVASEMAGTEHIDRTLAISSPLASRTVTINETSLRVRAEAVANIASPFLSILGWNTLTVAAASEAALAVGGNAETNLEIAMMLDVTGSMGGQKIIDMKTAAKDLVDIVVWDDQSRYTSKVALAPFSARVNVDTHIQNVTGLAASSGGNKLRKCVTERTGTHEYTDASPGPGAWFNGYNGTRTGSSNYSSSGNCTTPSSRIIPLTSSKTTLKSHIDSFSATGTTAGHLGTAWAWYLLSPNWHSIWPVSSRPAAYNTPDTQKIAILMTDGIYNTIGGVQYGDNSSQAQDASNRAVTLCAAMKTAGITVYTVGFDLGGSTRAINTLSQCATGPTYFYNTSTGDELRQAFRDIALQIAKLRLSN